MVYNVEMTERAKEQLDAFVRYLVLDLKIRRPPPICWMTPRTQKNLWRLWKAASPIALTRIYKNGKYGKSVSQSIGICGFTGSKMIRRMSWRCIMNYRITKTSSNAVCSRAAFFIFF